MNDVDKRSLGAARFSEISALVLLSMQMVRETLLNAARLRLPKATSFAEKGGAREQHHPRAGLGKATHTRVGDAQNHAYDASPLIFTSVREATGPVMKEPREGNGYLATLHSV